MAEQQDTPTVVVHTIVVPLSTRTIHVGVHLRDPDDYQRTLDAHPNATERSADAGDHWHRWLVYRAGDTEYTVHDPARYDTDPLGPQRRIGELQEMLSDVLLDGSMGPVEKATEVARLSERMRDHILNPPAEIRDGVPADTAAALEVLADAAAAPGVE
jgi:hypothetical protein